MATERTRPAGLLLEAALQAQVLSQRQAAAKIGRHNTLIQAIVEGRSRITADVATQLEQLDHVRLPRKRLLLLEADFDLFLGGAFEPEAASADYIMVRALFGAIQGVAPFSAKVCGLLTSKTSLGGSLSLGRGHAAFHLQRAVVRSFDIRFDRGAKWCDLRDGLSTVLQHDIARREVDAWPRYCRVIPMSDAEVVLFRRILAEQLHPTPVEGLEAVPLIDPWQGHRSILVPSEVAVKVLEQNLDNQATDIWSASTMSRFKDDCPKTYALVDRICQSGHSGIDEILLFEHNKTANPPGETKILYGLTDHHRRERKRPENLDIKDIASFVERYVQSIGSRHFADITEPDVHHGGDHIIAIQPIFGQTENAGCIYLWCYISHADKGWSKMETNIHNEHPILSKEFIREMGLVYPKEGK